MPSFLPTCTGAASRHTHGTRAPTRALSLSSERKQREKHVTTRSTGLGRQTLPSREKNCPTSCRPRHQRPIVSSCGPCILRMHLALSTQIAICTIHPRSRDAHTKKETGGNEDETPRRRLWAARCILGCSRSQLLCPRRSSFFPPPHTPIYRRRPASACRRDHGHVNPHPPAPLVGPCWFLSLRTIFPSTTPGKRSIPPHFMYPQCTSSASPPVAASLGARRICRPRLRLLLNHVRGTANAYY